MPDTAKGPQALPFTDLRFALAYGLLFAVYGIVSPYLQIMLSALGYGPAAVGLLLGIIEISGIAGPLVIARLVDRSGRYRVALVLCGGIVIATMPALVFFRNFPMTVLVICIFALGLKSLIPIMESGTMGLIERSSSGTGRKRPGTLRSGYGLIRSAGSAGFVILTLVFQFIPGFDNSPPFVYAVLIAGSVLSFLLSLGIVAELDTPKKKEKQKAAAHNPMPAVFALGLAVIALNRLAMTSIGSFFSLYVKEELRWNAVAGLWALSAAIEIPALILSGKLIHTFGAMKVMAVSSIAIAVRLIVYAVFPTPAGALTGQILHAACYGLFQPAAMAFVALTYPSESRTTGMALFMGFGVGLPTFVGSALGGVIVELLGYRVLFAVFSLFAVASVLLSRSRPELKEHGKKVAA